MKITPNMLDAMKVQFLKPIFEDDFPERGMKAWLTKIIIDKNSDCYKLFFDFTNFEEENLKYFTESYYPNNKTGRDKEFYTAIEAGYYSPKYSVYFGDYTDENYSFEEDILNFLKVLGD